MDRISTAPYANNNYESMEELRHLLMCASLELERTRTTAEIEHEVSEAKIQHLNILLDTTRRERDEAREQLHKFQQRLAEYMAHNVAPNATYVRSQWPDMDNNPPNMENNPQNMCSSSPHPVLDPVPLPSPAPQVGFDEQPWELSPHHQNLQEEVHRPTTSSPIDHHHHHQAECSNLAEKETFYQIHDTEQQQQHNKLRYVHQHEPPDMLPLLENPITSHEVWQSQAAMVEISEHDGGHMGYHQGVLPSLNLSMPVHLPEPPEANMQVMLSNLPERGKLLQAVMQAGPLLQTLLLAGPLPQWRHPPPAMESVEIPRLSMGLLPPPPPPPPPHVGHMQQPPLVTVHNSSALDDLQVTSPPISSCQHSPPPSCSRIDSDLQPTTNGFLGGGTASGTAKFICGPMLNSQDSAKPGLRFQYTKIR